MIVKKLNRINTKQMRRGFRKNQTHKFKYKERLIWKLGLTNIKRDS